MRLLLLSLCFLTLVACDSNTATPQSSASAEQPQAELRSEEITYRLGDLEMKGYLVYNANADGPRPGVLVVHEWWGHNDYVRNRAYMLARMGYTALAVDMYGDGKLAEHPEDAQAFATEVMSNMELMQQRFTAAKAVLREHESVDAQQVAAIGYCFGGAVVLNMARQGADLQAVASFHGSLGTATPAEEGAVQARALVLHGADDPMVPPEQVQAFKDEMDSVGADYEFIAYPDAVHSFTNPNAGVMGERFNLPLAYDESADEQSWERLQSFLEESFKP